MTYCLSLIPKIIIVFLLFCLLLLIPVFNSNQPNQTSQYQIARAATNQTLVSQGTGLTATYFDNKDFSGKSLKRLDSGLHFSWGMSGPDSQIGADTFSARWSGKLVPQFSQTYRIYTFSDDGVRLWINNKLLIDNWTDHAPTENSATINLTAGVPVDIKIEYFENYGQAVLHLLWSSPSTPKQVIPTSQLLAASVSPSPIPTPKPTLAPTPRPIVTPKPTPKPTPLGKTVDARLTWYGWVDNSPPSAQIAYAHLPNVIHKTASGVGSFSDPLTFASNPDVFPIGSKIYLPLIKKYAIMEDYCGGCSNDKAQGIYHVDFWMNSNNRYADQLLKCENFWTRPTTTVELDPPSSRPVSLTPLFDPATGICRTSP